MSETPNETNATVAVTEQTPASPDGGDGWRPLAFTTADGVRLHGRDYGSRAWRRTPVVCLAGLTRNAADFHALALHLSTLPEPRRVVALDMRGRGGSQNDPTGEYDLLREAADALDGMVAAGLHDVAIVGTSRGGILAMAIAAIRPGILRAVVLNDIGPVIEGAGLVQIKAYLARLGKPRSWPEAKATLRSLHGSGFPALTDAQWEATTRAIYTERDGRVVPAHDPAIHATLDGIEEATPPPMWAPFMGLAGVPVMSVRGALSTLFSAATQEAMAERHPNLAVHVVPNQGHAPLLDDGPTLEAIAAFLDAADAQTRPAT